jgi:predicted lipoprotein with Yx(FWY)xxD motif
MTPKTAVRPLVAAALMIAVIVVAGWNVRALGGDDPTSESPPAAEPVSAPAAQTVAAPAPQSTPRPTPLPLRARVSAGLGDTLMTLRGMTLYRSDRDGARPAVSRCVGVCTARWRPVLLADAGRGNALAGVELQGIDRRLLGVVRRPGGDRQLTVAGWPVYRFGGDRRPGDTLGHCVDGFSALTAEGAPAMAVRAW